jgi:hypothetical protein
MADRTVDFKLTAKDGASAVFEMAADAVADMRKEVEKDLKDIGNTATKTRGAVARAGGGGGGGAPKTGLKAIHEDKEGLERALKLGGALGIAELVGRSLERIPDAINKFHDAIRDGATKTEAFAGAAAGILPAIGSLAQGFRGAFDAIDANKREMYARQRDAEPVEDRRDDRQAIRENRDTNRRGILQAGKDAAIDAGDRLGVAGLRGDQRAIAEAAVARDQAQRKLNDLAAKRGSLSGDQAKELDAEIAKGREAVNAEYDERIANIKREGEKRELDAQRAQADKLQSLNLESAQAQLEAQDQFLNSKLLGLQGELKAERDAANRAYEDSLKDPDQDPATAAARRDDAIAAAVRRGHDKEVAARIEAAKDAAQKADEEYAKELDDEDAQKQRFKPARVGAFAGDTRLISGVTGAAASDPTLDPIRATAKSTDKAARLAELQEEHMRAIREALTKPDAFNVVK